MNKKIIIFSLVIGACFAFLLYKEYGSIKKEEDISETIYMLQVGAYKNTENVTKKTSKLNSYLVINESDMYHVYVGISKNKENVNKLKAFYEKNDNNIYVRESVVKNSEFLEYLDTTDYLLSETNNRDTILTIVKEVLKKYEEEVL